MIINHADIEEIDHSLTTKRKRENEAPENNKKLLLKQIAIDVVTTREMSVIINKEIDNYDGLKQNDKQQIKKIKMEKEEAKRVRKEEKELNKLRAEEEKRIKQGLKQEKQLKKEEELKRKMAIKEEKNMKKGTTLNDNGDGLQQNGITQIKKTKIEYEARKARKEERKLNRLLAEEKKRIKKDLKLQKRLEKEEEKIRRIAMREEKIEEKEKINNEKRIAKEEKKERMKQEKIEKEENKKKLEEEAAIERREKALKGMKYLLSVSEKYSDFYKNKLSTEFQPAKQ